MELLSLFKQAQTLGNQEVSFIARVRSNRVGKTVSFMVLNDGTTFEDIQVVYKPEVVGFIDGQNARISSIVEITGNVVLTPDKQQPFEIQASKIEILDQAIEDYPLQKKVHSSEFLREIAHLRARTKTFSAIFKIRSAAAFGIHKFFQENGYVYVHSPIITGGDTEGAGEQFLVTTNNGGKPEEDFFAKQVSLTVSGQLNAEALAQSFRKVYTFGPTFRAENSNTSRHAAEFWMIEPEIAFADLNENINVMENMLKAVVSHVMVTCSEELKFLEENLEQGLISKIKGIVDAKFKVNTYDEVLKILKDAISKGHKFENNDIFFGLDLGSEHERYICEVVNKCPTFVINYPKEIKAFYMKQNPDGKTVAACDLLVPGIGELIGGSQREDDANKIIARCKEIGIDTNNLDWYIKLRDYGYYKSSGFGLGFERLIMYITGASNIRDVIPFPRTPRNAEF